VCHIAESHPRNAIFAEEAAGATIDGVTSTNTDRRSVAWQLLKPQARCVTGFIGAAGVYEGLFERETLLGVTLNNDLALLVASNLAFL
jgi:hypothetical protein